MNASIMHLCSAQNPALDSFIPSTVCPILTHEIWYLSLWNSFKLKDPKINLHFSYRSCLIESLVCKMWCFEVKLLTSCKAMYHFQIHLILKHLLMRKREILTKVTQNLMTSLIQLFFKHHISHWLWKFTITMEIK